MSTLHPRSERRTQRLHEEATQVALETVAEGGPLAGVLDFLCRTMEDESRDHVIACIHPVNEDATMFCDTAAPSLDKGYREAINGVLVSSMTGPCCHAVATRRIVVVPVTGTGRNRLGHGRGTWPSADLPGHAAWRGQDVRHVERG